MENLFRILVDGPLGSGKTKFLNEVVKNLKKKYKFERMHEHGYKVSEKKVAKCTNKQCGFYRDDGEVNNNCLKFFDGFESKECKSFKGEEQ